MPEVPFLRDELNATRLPLLKRWSLYAARSLRPWQIRRTTMALESLSDDALGSIGIVRDDIPAIAIEVTAPERSPRAHVNAERSVQSERELIT
jgi:uncharacterized protein YjiS (DUF1127 family)